MSVDLKKVVDERIDRSALLVQTHDVVKGGSNVVVQSFDAVSKSSSNLDFVIQTPGLGVMTGRRVNIEVTIPITFTVTNSNTTAGVTYIWGGGDTSSSATNNIVSYGPCAFPFNSCITTAICQINTTNFNTQVQQNMPLVKRLLQSKDIRKSLWEVPTGMTQTVVQRGLGSILGQDEIVSVQRPMDDVVSNARVGALNASVTPTMSWRITSATNATVLPGSQTAGGFSTSFTLAAAAANPAVVPVVAVIQGELTVAEPLLLQPFTIDDEDAMFTNTNLINVRLNLRSPGDVPILRFSVAEGGAGTRSPTDYPSITAMALNGDWGTPRLRAMFITPSPTDNPITNCIYSTQFLNPLTTSIAISTTQAAKSALNSGDWLDSNIITLNTAPDAIAVFLQPRLGAVGNAGVAPLLAGETKGTSLGEFLFPITNLEVTWNNNPSLLATFNELDLYRRTIQNGMQFAWDTYRGFSVDSQTSATPYDPPNLEGTIGAPVLLQLNKDIPVEPGVGAGTAGVYTLKIRVKGRNQTNMANTTSPAAVVQLTSTDLVVVPIYSQYLVLKTGATSDLINTVATEQAVVTTAVTGVSQDKPQVGAGRRMIGGAMLASSRNKGQMGRVMDMMVYPGFSSGVAAPAAQNVATYLSGGVGVKRPRLDL